MEVPVNVSEIDDILDRSRNLLVTHGWVESGSARDGYCFTMRRSEGNPSSIRIRPTVLGVGVMMNYYIQGDRAAARSCDAIIRLLERAEKR